ncbi:nucleoside-diphosphate kinase [archaeon]|nr:nucleoside-diphosphate kinase [archaeon]
MLKERTLILIKPDAVQRGLAGEILKRFEQKALKVIGIKMVKPDKSVIENHYTLDLEWAENVGRKTKQAFKEKGIEIDKAEVDIGKEVRQKLINSLHSQPVIAIVLEGYHAVEIVRKIVGHTEPRQAMPGTIRGDFSVDSYALGDERNRSVKNLVHAADSRKNAEREIAVWFKETDLVDYERPEEKAAH